MEGNGTDICIVSPAFRCESGVEKERFIVITNCEFCAFYVYDEDGYAKCEVNLDEDEMARFMSSSYDSCPYYQTDDEYKIVRKQN